MIDNAPVGASFTLLKLTVAVAVEDKTPSDA
jgi:hypothetical protein